MLLDVFSTEELENRAALKRSSTPPAPSSSPRKPSALRAAWLAKMFDRLLKQVLAQRVLLDIFQRCDRYGSCKAPLGEIAAAVDRSIESVRVAVRMLEQQGLIRVRQRPGAASIITLRMRVAEVDAAEALLRAQPARVAMINATLADLPANHGWAVTMVVLALAADPDGRVYEPVATLAARLRIGRRELFQRLHDLSAEGFIERIGDAIELVRAQSKVAELSSTHALAGAQNQAPTPPGLCTTLRKKNARAPVSAGSAVPAGRPVRGEIEDVAGAGARSAAAVVAWRTGRPGQEMDGTSGARSPAASLGGSIRAPSPAQTSSWQGLQVPPHARPREADPRKATTHSGIAGVAR